VHPGDLAGEYSNLAPLLCWRRHWFEAENSVSVESNFSAVHEILA